MPLQSGDHLGRYEILQPLGAGGMGEVYRARDTRLDREVAIKILPEAVARDPDRLARFEREAKAVAALSHPNILALHDAGTENHVTFAVMELLQGETLRQRLSQGAMPLRRAVDTAIQIARGLTAAHAKGLVHRDLKPENVFLVADGQVKILDFGLAKAADAGGSTETATLAAMTDPGTVLGTVGYMAPEQIRGQPIDARTDLFALGAVLYEMITGERAFRRDTAAETMTAILREDVPDLPAAQAGQAPALDRIIRHCLEKNPAERFQSARDVAFALEALSGSTGASSSTGSLGPDGAAGSSRAGWRRSRAAAAALTAGAMLVIAAGAWAAGLFHVGAAGVAGSSIDQISYQRLTFDEGFVFAARFARDGRTIVYSADWDNQARDIFVTSLDNSGARALGYKNGDLLAVAPDGALAILLDGTIPTGNPYFRQGTVARASLTGGSPRKELDRVSFADFAPDGTLVVTRTPSGLRSSSLEWPPGQVIVGTDSVGGTPMPNPRVSPDGAHVAFFVCSPGGCVVKIAERSGKVIATSPSYSDWWGLGWTPDSREVWYSVVTRPSGYQCTVFALDLSGRSRTLLAAPGALTLHDVAADRRILASFDQVGGRIEFRASSNTPARDLSWKEGGTLHDIASNGAVLFGETGDSGGPGGAVYIRRLEDSEPIRISDGIPLSLSPDATLALVRVGRGSAQLSLVPTAAGLAAPIDLSSYDAVAAGVFLADGRLLLELKKPGTDTFTVFVRPKAGGPLSPVLPAGFHLTTRSVSPDSKRLVAAEDNGTIHVCTVPAMGLASCTPVPGATSIEQLAGWTPDSKALIVYRPYPAPVQIEKIWVDTGRREPMTVLQTATPAVTGIARLFVTSSGSMVYSYPRNRSALYAISGLR